MASQGSGKTGNFLPLTQSAPPHVEYRAAGDTEPVAEFWVELREMRCQGYLVDVVAEVGVEVPSDAVIKEQVKLDAALAEGLEASHIHSTQQDLTENEATNLLHSIARTLRLDTGYSPRRGYAEEEYRRGLHRLCHQAIHNSTIPKHMSFQFWFDQMQNVPIKGHTLPSIYASLSADDMGTEEERDRMFGRFSATCFGYHRRFVSTDNRNIGIMPRNVKKGDMVVIFLGCNIPAVLREGGDAEQKYRVVGECYLNGYMYGEFLGMSDARMRSFTLVRANLVVKFVV